VRLAGFASDGASIAVDLQRCKRVNFSSVELDADGKNVRRNMKKA